MWNFCQIHHENYPEEGSCSRCDEQEVEEW